MYVGNTVYGSQHDYALFKDEFSVELNWFENIKCRVDLGYQGIKTDYQSSQNIFIPHKKPRKSKKNPKPELTEKQKLTNKKLGKKRVYVEHAIGGMKRFQILNVKLRNKRKDFKNIIIRLAAGLFNLKNNFTISNLECS